MAKWERALPGRQRYGSVMTHARVWKFRPPAGREDEFHAAYSGKGNWARLFEQAAGVAQTLVEYETLGEIERYLRGSGVAVSQVLAHVGSADAAAYFQKLAAQPVTEEAYAHAKEHQGRLRGEYERMLKAAGFSAVQVIDSGADLNAYSAMEGQSGCCSPAASAGGCCGGSGEGRASEMPASSSSTCCDFETNPSGSGCCTAPAPGSGDCCTPKQAEPAGVHQQLGELLSRYDVNDYAASVQIFAVKER